MAVGESLESLDLGYLESYFKGLWLAANSDPIVTSLTIGSLALGVVSRKASATMATFFLTYATIRTVNTVANAIGASGLTLGRALSSMRSGG